MRAPRFIIFLSLAASAVLSATAFAQTPTAAQQQAIRSNCVADYRANCSGVPPHGMQALVCLEQHESKLSSGCKSAVEAIGSTPASASKKAVDSKPASAGKETVDSTSASADKKTKAAAATTEATSPEDKSSTVPVPESKPTEMTEKAVTASGAPQLSFRGEMRLAAEACARDFRRFCPNLPVGHGNVLFCLKVHGPKLDSTCRNALLEAGEIF